MKSPIFIFSMPRSGSTLLQKILTTHPKIKTHNETWLMLPLAYWHDKKEVQSIFGFNSFKLALNDVIESLPNKEVTYNEIVRDFYNSIYTKLGASGEVYFLDKTPRYYFIIDFINKVYPDAKFIFLTRDPREIYASYITSFRDNSIYRFDEFDRDFNNGYNLLLQGYNKYKSKSLHISYEDLINNTSTELEIISKYLEINFNNFNIEDAFNESQLGHMGDKKIRDTNKILTNKDNWKNVLNSYPRKVLLVNMINNIDDDYFKIFLSQRKDKVIKDIKSHYINPNLKDLANMVEIYFVRFVKYILRKTIHYKDYY